MAKNTEKLIELLDNRERLTIDLIIADIKHDNEQIKKISDLLSKNHKKIVGLYEED